MSDPTFDVASEDDDAPLTDSISQSERGDDDIDADEDGREAQDEPDAR